MVSTPQCNGIWLLALLGRVSMLTAWAELFRSLVNRDEKVEFVSADARTELGRRKSDLRAYEMLSRDSGKAEDSGLTGAISPITPVTPAAKSLSGRSTPDYFGSTAPAVDASSNYQPPARSFSSPRPPAQPWDRKVQVEPQGRTWDVQQTFARPGHHGNSNVNVNANGRSGAFNGVNPLGMNKF